jgi:hypothetical protein
MQQANSLVNTPANDVIRALEESPGSAVEDNVKSSSVADVPVQNPPRAVAPQPRVEDNEQPRILQTLNHGDHVSSEALRTHDTSQLTQYFTGAALADQLSAVQVLVNAGAHVHATMHSRDVQSVRISGDQAVVDQVLDYEIEFRNPQEQCLQRIARHSSQQTITLQKQNGRWLVAHENVLTQATPASCY